MSRTILTTCGTSLFTSSCWGDPFYLNKEPLSKSDIYSDPQRYRKKQAQCEAITRIAQKNDPSGASLANSFDRASWDDLNLLRDLPAELASLNAMKVYLESKNKSLNVDDEIILLHSGNNDGIFCATTLEQIIKDKRLLNPASIKHKCFDNLDPAKRDEFGQGLSDIWNSAQILNNSGNEVILNLTGGYKAVGILLGGFAGRKTGTNVFYLHEDAGYNQIFIMSFLSGNKIQCKYFDISKKPSYQTSSPGPDS